ncbi:putative ferric-chelate reductase 1 [Macrobrachium nipponense]|uniref:putative ferric-chelate reductase 1 n=1 Tax=Macrobrachium nipponense TaxID=159736 RepID=UPI0030C8130C
MMEINSRALCRTVVLAMIALFHLAEPFSRNDLTPACDSMMPGHGFQPQSSLPPFQLVANRDADGKYTVTLSTLDGTKFEGFFIQARNQNNAQVGAFQDVGPSARIIGCPPGSAVQHDGKRKKTQVSARWDPQTYHGPVQFRATVVKSYKTFWINLNNDQVVP